MFPIFNTTDVNIVISICCCDKSSGSLTLKAAAGSFRLSAKLCSVFLTFSEVLLLAVQHSVSILETFLYNLVL